MFVSVVIDPGGKESSANLSEVLASHGFERVQRACWESAVVNDSSLQKLKQDVDRVTDYYDVVRMYQFPVDGVFAVTTLYKKKWRRVVIRPPASK
ncbi:MAG: CRISPR-associated endonuclease Cas2 [Treponema sp.]|nr:MAG: CRISPR-associated endonuclease Cas2 [Treponema sp.]